MNSTFFLHDLQDIVVLVRHGLGSIIREIAQVWTRKNLFDARSWCVFFLSIHKDIFIVIGKKPTKSLCYSVRQLNFSRKRARLTYLGLENTTVGASPGGMPLDPICFGRDGRIDLTRADKETS